MRINKFLCECGLCSRREADRLIEAGRVTINHKPAVNGSQAEDSDLVEVDGRAVRRKLQKTYWKYYKPQGVVCTFETREKNNLGDHLRSVLAAEKNASGGKGGQKDKSRLPLSLPGRLTYAGRLDKNSEGLLLLTDDGDLIQEMMAARNAHEKEYEVIVNKPVTEAFLQAMAGGVHLKELDVTTRPCRIEKTGPDGFTIILTQGLNRQIRRMCEAFGYGVKKLKRVRVVTVRLENMKPGEIVPLTEAEIRSLQEARRHKGEIHDI